MKKVLVTGIGGVVGQGILRNIRAAYADIYIVGTNVTMISSGNFYCDKVIKVPFSYEESFRAEMKRIVEEEAIDLIIPSTDYESYYLGLFQSDYSCYVASSPAEVTSMCLDKLINYKEFNKKGIPFAGSLLPSEYSNQFPKTIVKPREGRGSRNIFVNPASPSQFDDTYVVQELLEGPEITTTFYIDKKGELLGMITFYRELEMGNTTRCEVVDQYDDQLLPLIQKIISSFPFRGSCNLQSMVTENGVIPFEINCRISGTNSVRSQFGFEDVKYTIEEYLFDRALTKPVIRKGAAMRIILDAIFHDTTLNEITSSKPEHYIF